MPSLSDARSNDETLWYFDGYNVLHAVLLGRDRNVAWWHRDFQRRVVAWVEGLTKGPPIDGAPVTVVFDAERPLTAAEIVTSDLVAVVYTPNADDWIVETCRNDSAAHVVTADRALQERVKATGSSVSKPWAFETSAQS